MRSIEELLTEGDFSEVGEEVEEEREELLGKINQAIDRLAGEEGEGRYPLPTEETRRLFGKWAAFEVIILDSGTSSEYLPWTASFELEVTCGESKKCLLAIESNGHPVNKYEPVLNYELGIEGEEARLFCYSRPERRESLEGISVTDNCLQMFRSLLDLVS